WCSPATVHSLAQTAAGLRRTDARSDCDGSGSFRWILPLRAYDAHFSTYAWNDSERAIGPSQKNSRNVRALKLTKRTVLPMRLNCLKRLEPHHCPKLWNSAMRPPPSMRKPCAS